MAHNPEVAGSNPAPATNFRRSRPFPGREGAFCVSGTVVKTLSRNRAVRRLARDGGDGVIRDETARTRWTFLPAIAGCFAQRSTGTYQSLPDRAGLAGTRVAAAELPRAAGQVFAVSGYQECEDQPLLEFGLPATSVCNRSIRPRQDRGLSRSRFRSGCSVRGPHAGRSLVAGRPGVGDECEGSPHLRAYVFTCGGPSPGWLAERGGQFWVCPGKYGMSAHEAGTGTVGPAAGWAASYHFLELC